MTSPIFTRRSLIALLMAGALAATASYAKDKAPGKAAKIKSVLAVGDSLTDTGNLAAALGFSDGPVTGPGGELLGVILNAARLADSDLYINRLAADLTSPLDATASASGGGNFAFAGAVSNVGLAPFVPFNAPGTDLQSQTQQLLAYTASKFKKKDLIVIFIGSNDIFAATTAALSLPPGSFDPIAALGVTTANIVDVIKQLSAQGAENFLVFDSADVSRTPVLTAALPPEGLALARNLSIVFNQQLFAGLSALQGDTAVSANVWYVPTFAITEFIASPAGALATGITSTTPCAPAFGFGVPCDQSAFWDFVHPSSAVHKILADSAVTILLQPALVQGAK